MKAFLISPEHAALICNVQTVEVRTNANGDADVRHICELLGASCFDLVPTEEGKFAKHCGYVDGEGLLKPQPGHILCPELYPLPLAGPLLLLGETFSHEDGWVPSAATLLDDEVVSLFSKAYVTRRYAKAAHDLAEIQAMQANPDMIVMRASSEM